MQSSLPTHSPSPCRHDGGFVASDNGIGQLFRDYGEQYIRIYRPSRLQIQLIRSIRVCKTPALGGRQYVCKQCAQSKYVYFGCGNSRCPKCQGVKRLQWQEKISTLLLRSPYVHMVFTMPHLLNRLAKSNPKQIYNCLMRSAWSSLKTCCAENQNLGALPGAIMVLHTFGSDLKYHVHVHVLVSFGGIDQYGNWQWPKQRNKLVGFRQIRRVFRKHFLQLLQKQYDQLYTLYSYSELQEELMKKSWCVHAEPPTSNTDMIRTYLGKYICRIGLSKQRFHYDALGRKVQLIFKDYKKAIGNKTPTPLAIKKMRPLVAIHQIMQHCLPAYFQKCRFYGIHASASQKKYDSKIPNQIRNNKNTIRTLFQILSQLLGMEGLLCDQCGHDTFDQYELPIDRKWKLTWLFIPHHNKGSPYHIQHINRSESALKWKRATYKINQQKRP